MILEVKGRTLIVTDSNVKNIYQLDNVSSVKQSNGKVVVTFLKDVNFLTLKNITSPVFADNDELVAWLISKISGTVSDTDVVTVDELKLLTPTLVEEISDTTYVGYSTDGVVSNATWAIYKVIETATLTTIQMPLTGLKFDQVWNNRASITFTNITI